MAARLRAATPIVELAYTTGTSSTGSTNRVRRMPSTRTSERSSYSARSTAAIDGFFMRAALARNTLLGSVAWRPTRSRATSTTSEALASAARRWRRPKRAASLLVGDPHADRA